MEKFWDSFGERVVDLLLGDRHGLISQNWKLEGSTSLYTHVNKPKYLVWQMKMRSSSTQKTFLSDVYTAESHW